MLYGWEQNSINQFQSHIGNMVIINVFAHGPIEFDAKRIKVELEAIKNQWIELKCKEESFHIYEFFFVKPNKVCYDKPTIICISNDMVK